MTDNRPTGPGPDHGPGEFSDDGVTVVAGVVIETRPGQGPFVACRLENEPGLEIVGGDGDRRLAVVWTARSGKALEAAAKRLLERDEEIIGIFPTFVGRDDDEPELSSTARSVALEGIAKAETDDR